jgi:hypothetical protein
MAKEALAYYKEEIEKREQAAIERDNYVPPPPKKFEPTREEIENNYTDDLMFSTLGGRDLPEKYGRARSTDRDS